MLENWNIGTMGENAVALTSIHHSIIPLPKNETNTYQTEKERKMKLLRIIIVLWVSMGFCAASAQDITTAERGEIIDQVIDQLAHRYVDPNLGQKAAQTIKQKKRETDVQRA